MDETWEGSMAIRLSILSLLVGLGLLAGAGGVQGARPEAQYGFGTSEAVAPAARFDSTKVKYARDHSRLSQTRW